MSERRTAEAEAIERDVVAVRGRLDYSHQGSRFGYVAAVEALDRLAALAHEARRAQAARAANSEVIALDFTTRRAGLPPLIVCPRCDGQLHDQGSCGFCRNAGYLDYVGEPLQHAQIVQIAATAALAAGLQLTLASRESHSHSESRDA